MALVDTLAAVVGAAERIEATAVTIGAAQREEGKHGDEGDQSHGGEIGLCKSGLSWHYGATPSSIGSLSLSDRGDSTKTHRYSRSFFANRGYLDADSG